MMAEKVPALLNSDLFVRIEKEYYRRYIRAIGFLSQDARIKVKEILLPFKEVESKREIIALLSSKASPVIVLYNAYKDKDFPKIFILLQQHNTLEKTPFIVHLKEKLELKVDEAKEALAKGDYKKALLIAQTYAYVTWYKKDLLSIKTSVKNEAKYYKAYKNSDLVSFFSYIEGSVKLRSLDASQTEIDENFVLITNSCKHIKEEGVGSILAKLGELNNIHYWQNHIANCIKLSLLNQLEQSKLRENIDYKKAFDLYTNQFGYDYSVQKIAKSLGQEQPLIPFIDR